MYRNLLFVTIVFLYGICAQAAEEARFDIMLFGKKIGYIKVTREIKNDSTELYILDTYGEAKILWIDRTNRTRYEVEYRNGKLYSSVFKEQENGKDKRWTNVKWNGSLYVVDSYRGRRVFTERPSHSVVKLYFEDLKGVKKFFYESEAEFGTISETAPNVYEFKSSDGNHNTYTYKGGRLQQIDLRQSIVTVKMVRTN